jgi:O-antigen/teichoic acid export membrane protein
MVFLMLIGLYTSRVILKTLGVADYGTYNLVGGVISMFSILTSSLSTAISRFITFELGKGQGERLNRVFSTSVNVQLILGGVVVLLGETIGVWFLNTHLQIPADRMVAANWVLQCAIASFVLGLLMVPYNASLIAHENMNIFAYISILEAVLKLAIVFALYISPYDKLITYAMLLFAVSCLIRWIYASYCKQHYEECKFRLVYDKSLLKGMTGFAGWHILSDGSWALNNYGINVLLNIFFGPVTGLVLNAARGIATQVDNIVQSFVRNFMTALNPQITKSYAAGDFEYMHKLVFAGAKYSFFLMMFFTIPILLETDLILELWLDIVPDYTVVFVRLTLLSSMCVILGNTLITSILATGKIRNYELVIGGMALSVFPITWMAFKLGASPVATYVIYFCTYFMMIFVRLYMVKDLIHISAWSYVKEVFIRVSVVGAGALLFPLLITFLQDDSVLRLLEVCFSSVVCVIGSVFLLGMKKDERTLVFTFIRGRFVKSHL